MCRLGMTRRAIPYPTQGQRSNCAPGSCGQRSDVDIDAHVNRSLGCQRAQTQIGRGVGGYARTAAKGKRNVVIPYCTTIAKGCRAVVIPYCTLLCLKTH